MLTKKQKSVFVYIQRFLSECGYSPSQEEIRKEFNLASTSTAEHYLKELQKKGYISIAPGKARAIEILASAQNVSSFKNLNILSRSTAPLLGAANAGIPSLVAEENVEALIELPAHLASKKNIFALRIEGDSMNLASYKGKKLVDGSIVFIDSNINAPQPNDIVLVVVNGCATIKKLYSEQNSNFVKLLPVSSNSIHKPIFLSANDEFFVNGVVVGVL